MASDAADRQRPAIDVGSDADPARSTEGFLFLSRGHRADLLALASEGREGADHRLRPSPVRRPPHRRLLCLRYRERARTRPHGLRRRSGGLATGRAQMLGPCLSEPDRRPRHFRHAHCLCGPNGLVDGSGQPHRCDGQRWPASQLCDTRGNACAEPPPVAEGRPHCFRQLCVGQAAGVDCRPRFRSAAAAARQRSR